MLSTRTPRRTLERHDDVGVSEVVLDSLRCFQRPRARHSTHRGDFLYSSGGEADRTGSPASTAQRSRYLVWIHGIILLSAKHELKTMSRVLITGAAGNLGTLLARHLKTSSAHTLRLMYHRTPLAADLIAAGSVEAVRADLADPRTLTTAVAGVDTIVHFAGVLFRPRPERFLPETNTRWFANLVGAALDAHVPRVILTSFPQTEGPTSVEQPATGRLDREPVAVHARTRLEEERLLMAEARRPGFTPIVLRFGMVYGRGILMIDAARWLAARRLLGVWKEPTLFQLISSVDCVRAFEAAIDAPQARGIYHIGDEQPVTIQEFLDKACDVWGCARPFRVPIWSIDLLAAACEAFALATQVPLHLIQRLRRVHHRQAAVPLHRFDLLKDAEQFVARVAHQF